jgi:gliding motility-associated-like protein
MKKRLLLQFLFLLSCILYSGFVNAQMSGTNAYILGTSVEIGVDGTYGYEGLDATVSVPPAGTHWRSGGTNYFGFVANPQVNAWATFDGDFFTPGSPENGWGLEVGGPAGIQGSNNCANGSFGTQDISGAATYSATGTCREVDWFGTMTTGGTNVGVHINYHLGVNDLYYTTTVSITNNTSATIPELYYYRNLDPDNNEPIGFDFSTQNTIVSEPAGSPGGCNLAHVKATSLSPASQPMSYLGLAAVGANFRVCYGGFSNRDASDLWTGGITGSGTFTQTIGATNFADEAISLSYKIANLAPGAVETFKFVIILDDAAAANAIDNLLYFTYIGASGTPPSSCNPSIDSISTCGAPVPIQVNGTIVNDYNWTWSPSTGLSSTTGPTVTANPTSNTLYTVSGTPINPCLTATSMQVWVIVTAAAGANPYITPVPNLCSYDPPFNLTVDSAGGVWSGSGITSSGLFDPGSVAPGTYMISYTKPGGCNSTDTVLVTVIGANSATITQPPVICVGAPAFNLTAVDAGGVWSGTGITNPSTGLFNPSTVGTSLITYAFSGSCPLQDTVMVTVAPNFTYSVSQSSTNSCLLDPVQLNVNAVSPSGTYTYDWSPGTALSDSTIANPTATFIAPGTYTYSVTVTNAGGCAQTSTLSVVAAPAFAPTITAVGDTSMCGTNTIPLSVNFGGVSVPATCGPSTTGGCGGAAFTNIVGTGLTSNSTTSYPAPYGNWYTSVKQQFLYTAAELNAAGITGGKIDQIDFNVTAISGITTYHFYSISMGCTNITAFPTAPAAFQTGLTNVFSAATYTIGTGWNAHPFSTAFNWDGISNVIVEVCFNELNPFSNYTNNSSTLMTTTSYVSSIASLSDANDQCTTPDVPWTTNSAHPDIRFHYCSVVPNPANYTYLWTPSSGVIADSTAQNTTAQPPGTMDYYVTVTDIAGGCYDIDTVSVTIFPFTGVNPVISSVPAHCTSDPLFNLTVNDTGGVWTGTGIVDDSLGTFDPGSVTGGNYIITYTSPGACNGSDTVIVTVMSSSAATITQPAPVCEGTSPFNITAAASGGVWSGTGITDSLNGTFDPAIAGTYLVTYTFGGLCPSQDTVMVTVNPVSTPVTGFSYPTSPICALDTVTLPSTVLNFIPGGTFTGSPGGLSLNSSTGAIDPGATPPGTYTVTYSIPATTCGPAGSSSTSVTITPGINPVTGFSYPSGICDNDSSVAPVNVGGFTAGGIYSASPALTIDDSTGVIDVISSSPGTYTITYSVNGVDSLCTLPGTGSASVTINPLPIISLTSDQVIWLGNSTLLVAGGGQSYLWVPGTTLSCTACDSTVASPSSTTTYCVMVTDSMGCIDSSCVKVSIDLPCQTNRFMDVPNAFTPNGDGYNDELCLNGWDDCVSEFVIFIYDRWGEKVYESTNPHFCWDGIYKGKLLDPAVFVYFIKAAYITSGDTPTSATGVVEVNKKGNISIVY